MNDKTQVVFKRAKEGAVKVVLATNIAETSITLPGTRQNCRHQMFLMSLIQGE
jgi:HrpA-like RNA helicase